LVNRYAVALSNASGSQLVGCAVTVAAEAQHFTDALA
jgi:hypothetical protein